MVYWYKEEGQEKKEGGKTPKSKEPQKEKELRPKISFRPKTHFETDFREFEKKSKEKEELIENFQQKEEMELYEIRYYMELLENHNKEILAILDLYVREELPRILKHGRRWIDAIPFWQYIESSEKLIRNYEEMSRTTNLLKLHSSATSNISYKEQMEHYITIINGIRINIENMKSSTETFRDILKEAYPENILDPEVLSRIRKILERVEKLQGYHKSLID